MIIENNLKKPSKSEQYKEIFHIILFIDKAFYTIIFNKQKLLPT